MAEPSSSATAGIAIATGAITITGSIFGLQFDALLFGLFGGLVSLMHLPPMTRGRMAGTLATAALLGALGAPIVARGLTEYLPWLGAVSGDVLRMAAAFTIGLGAQVAIPLGMGALRRWGGGQGVQGGHGAPTVPPGGTP